MAASCSMVSIQGDVAFNRVEIPKCLTLETDQDATRHLKDGPRQPWHNSRVVGPYLEARAAGANGTSTGLGRKLKGYMAVAYHAGVSRPNKRENPTLVV